MRIQTFIKTERILEFFLIFLTAYQQHSERISRYFHQQTLTLTSLQMALQLLQRDHYRTKQRDRHHLYLLRKPRSVWNKGGKTDDWWVKLRDGVKPEEQWHLNLRLQKTQFYRLLSELAPHMDVGNDCPNYRAIPADKKLALTLYYLAHTGCLLLTANAFGVDLNN